MKKQVYKLLCLFLFCITTLHAMDFKQNDKAMVELKNGSFVCVSDVTTYIPILSDLKNSNYEAFLALAIACKVPAAGICDLSVTIIPYINLFKKYNIIDDQEKILKQVKDIVQSCVTLVTNEDGEFYFSVTFPLRSTS